MNQFMNYIILQELQKTKKSTIFRVKHKENGEIYKLTLYKTNYPASLNITGLLIDFNRIKKIKLDGIIKIHEVIHYDKGIAVVQDDYDGTPLSNIIGRRTFSIDDFLPIAIQITNILAQLHFNRIVHRGIKPANIWFSKISDEIKLLNFGIWSLILPENEMLYRSEFVKDVLYYFSPEQTGRIDRSVDYRSDIYSLGMIFYEMLTGTFPFTTNDPFEIIHAHIARNPRPPSVINKDIPEVLSDIIMKLLVKNAEQRYQNCISLLNDLTLCRKNFLKRGTKFHFPIAQNNYPISYIDPRIIVGREKILSDLMNAYQRVKKEGREIVLLRGDPGIGKSTLIYEMYKFLIEYNIYNISGKYEQFKKDIPYSAIIQAFKGIIKRILTESEDRVLYWKKKIIEALGSNGKVITDVIPDLKLIIGEQPEVPELQYEEAENRFIYVFNLFIGVLATRDHPLIILLDDLQWADLSSLHLIKNIFLHSSISHLLIIGTYRINEKNEINFIQETIAELEKEFVRVRQIDLGPLTPDHITTLIHNIFKTDTKKTYALAYQIYEKTHGNPFFIKQFIKLLYAKDLITLDYSSGWSWDINEIAQIPITDNIVDLIVKKIDEYSAFGIEILKICSCIGNNAPITTLSILTEMNTRELLTALKPVIDDGLITIYDGIISFNHDRIRLAIYSTIFESIRDELHYNIGTYFLEKLLAHGHDDTNLIFTCVNQLNLGSNFVKSQDEKDRYAQLNYRAGVNAKKCAAFSSALTYFEKGIALIGNKGFIRLYDLWLNLHTEATQCAFICSDYEKQHRYFNEINIHARSVIDKIKNNRIMVQTLMAQNKMKEALETAGIFLKRFNIKIPLNPGKLHIAFELIRIKLMLLGKKVEDLINLPDSENPHNCAAMEVLYYTLAAAYEININYFVVALMRMVYLSLKYGNYKISSSIYTAFGIILCSIDDIPSGYHFGKLGLKLLKQNKYTENELKTNKVSDTLVFNTFIKHWKKHLSTCLKPLLLNYQNALENGSKDIAVSSIMVYCSYACLSGVELPSLITINERYYKTLDRFKLKTDWYIFRLYYQTTLNLHDPTGMKHIVKGKIYDEDIMLPDHIVNSNKQCIINLYFIKLMLSYIFKQYDKACQYGDKLSGIKNESPGLVIVPYSYFYTSLAFLANIDNNRRYSKRRILNIVKKNQKKMYQWAKHAPMNYLHKYYLVKAEKYRVLHENEKAVIYYDRAITYAAKNNFIPDEALAYEHAALFYHALNNNEKAGLYMREAYSAYFKWGALAKVYEIKNTYPTLLKSSVEITTTGTVPDHSQTLRGDRGIKQKILITLGNSPHENDRLETIINTIVKFVGAQKGLYVINNADEESKQHLFVKARCIENKTEFCPLMPVEECTELSQTVINYVKRTKKWIIISHAGNPEKHDLPLSTDYYIKHNNIKSIMCIPITTGNTHNLSSMIYLENNDADHAFSKNIMEYMTIIGI